jgi:hypothetical protein
VQLRANLKVVDHGFAKLAKTVEELARGGYVKVGVLDSGPGGESHGTLTNAQLATIMEFGTADGSIPARPFVTQAIDAHRPEYVELLKKLLRAVVSPDNPMTLERALGLLGAKAAADIKTYVTDGTHFVENAPETVARKGSSVPLIDTAQMLGAISWLVVLGTPSEAE